MIHRIVKTSVSAAAALFFMTGCAHRLPGPGPKMSGEVKTVFALRYVDAVKGKGVRAEVGRRVTVHYTGWLKDGKKFDSSVDRGQPFVFELGAGRVITGWDTGVVGMRVGGKRRLIIPSPLAYGRRQNGAIPPNSELTFDIELLAVDSIGPSSR